MQRKTQDTRYGSKGKVFTGKRDSHTEVISQKQANKTRQGVGRNPPKNRKQKLVKNHRD